MNKKSHIDLSQRLFVELGTSLLMETHEKVNSLSGKLIGMKVGSYLIVEVSGVKSDSLTLSKGEQVQIKYANQDDIFSFSSIVLRILNQPDNLFFLQYPDKVKSCNIRSHKRVDCFLPIHGKTHDRQYPGIITNISAKGCLCMIDHFKSWENINGQEIELIFSYGDLETLSINGEIRSTQIQGQQIKLGIKFNKVDQFSQSLLATLVPALRL
jgi:c-di-GMP-binding flagellar brake protein YcgR